MEESHSDRTRSRLREQSFNSDPSERAPRFQRAVVDYSKYENGDATQTQHT